MTSSYEETESYSTSEAFEFASEAAIRDHRRPAPQIRVPGGVAGAILKTPNGDAKLTFPQPASTLAQYQALERALNATNTRLSAATADLARLRGELAQQRSQYGSGAGAMSMMLPLLMQMQLRDDLEDHKHVGSTAAVDSATISGSSSNLLPLLLFMQPNLFGQSVGGAQAAGAQAAGAQDGMSQFMMLFVMMEIFKK